MNGWTHRRKNKSREPYVKQYSGDPDATHALFVDQNQQFWWLAREALVEL